MPTIFSHLYCTILFLEFLTLFLFSKILMKNFLFFKLKYSIMGIIVYF
ncbi:hypothetical protein HMPREF3206_01867 [Fusobacterium equinum]|uniref:Uncharacterized protein n=1 Tax=Fusobacterium equinum TaxID=134605 RepID=A0A133N6I5_9FUSO|nr:hypothetical protein HMPREF3206_01867 [Fusobacterium equinum]